ncbi:hypothetical protein EVAR_54900_1 [Eumeta japonica]|uniref:Uncharacterized protein n=1 Tax=Eumeta variegata TaxID=151549 RepID=A0A4C1Z115_EUMVA|nr:hypothetical protein EVAR_54900_1 [Eumeta japonica]
MKSKHIIKTKNFVNEESEFKHGSSTQVKISYRVEDCVALSMATLQGSNYLMTNRKMMVVALVPAAQPRGRSSNVSDKLRESNDLFHENY